jgi:hypothetical protein
LTLRVVLLPQRGVDSPVTARRSQFHPPNPFLTMNKVEAEQHYHFEPFFKWSFSAPKQPHVTAAAALARQNHP